MERTRDGGLSVAEALPEVNARLLQAATAEQREIFETSALDEYLLDAERDEKLRARAVAQRTEPSLEQFLPRRGDGLVLSASDIETYRTCPLKYKFARVFRIPSEPTLNQRFGILVHQVLERFHGGGATAGLAARAARAARGRLAARRVRRLRGGAPAARRRRRRRCCATTSASRTRTAEPVWFERAFAFRLGPHLLRGRVDRVDKLPDGGYELIDYKTGRPKTGDAAARGRPALALRGRRARVVAARGRPPGLLLRARRREGAGRALATRTATGSPTRCSRSPTGSSARASSRRRRGRRARCATTGSRARRPRNEGEARSSPDTDVRHGGQDAVRMTGGAFSSAKLAHLLAPSPSGSSPRGRARRRCTPRRGSTCSAACRCRGWASGRAASPSTSRRPAARRSPTSTATSTPTSASATPARWPGTRRPRRSRPSATGSRRAAARP